LTLSAARRDLHSFPTRRSSDLRLPQVAFGAVGEAAAALTEFLLAHAAPHAVLLPGGDGPLGALLADRAGRAHLLGGFDLFAGVAAVGEERARVSAGAGGVLEPVENARHAATSRLAISGIPVAAATMCAASSGGTALPICSNCFVFVPCHG